MSVLLQTRMLTRATRLTDSLVYDHELRASAFENENWRVLCTDLYGSVYFRWARGCRKAVKRILSFIRQPLGSVTDDFENKVLNSAYYEYGANELCSEDASKLF
jgi:hypothetical protein